MIKLFNYNENSARNATGVTVGNLTLYFSYETIVAFRSPSTGLVVSQNYWGATTGKHLNWIDGGDKSSRLTREDFEAKLEVVLKEKGLA